MIRRYNFSLCLLLILLLGIGIGYNLRSRHQTITAVGDVLEIIGRHYVDTADMSGLEQVALYKLLAPLKDASVISHRAIGTDAAANYGGAPEIKVVKTGPGAACIKLSALSEGAYTVFVKELEAISAAGVNRLTLDLRGVKGTAFDDAIEIADEFLTGDKQIASIKRANRRVQVYRAKRPGLFETGALTIQTDSLTGGAGKLICAALRDWKRAQITGSCMTDAAIEMKRFLVGQQYELVLPTGRYYAPLGEKL